MAVLIVPPRLAVIVTEVVDETEVVATVKVVLVAPAGTVAFKGTVATALFLDRDTTKPPDGAAPVKLTVPCEEFPPTSVVGFKITEDRSTGAGGGRAGAVTVNVALLVVVPLRPAMVTKLVDETVLVATVNVARVVPGATVTLEGTVATAVLLESVTASPLAGAAPVMLIVPCVALPPTTLVGFSVRDSKSGAGGGGGVTVSVAVLVVLA